MTGGKQTCKSLTRCGTFVLLFIGLCGALPSPSTPPLVRQTSNVELGKKPQVTNFKPLRQLSLEFAEALVEQQGFNSPITEGEAALSPEFKVDRTTMSVAATKDKEDERKPDPKPKWSLFSANNIAVFLIIATTASFAQVKYNADTTVSAPTDSNYVLGLAVAGLALVGNAAVGALRKILSQYNVGSAPQVGIATLVQGIFAILYCLYSGDLKIDSKEEFVNALPPRAFWIAAIGASILNGVVKTLETKAFAETDISLCAPFLAFDPVMQFVVGVALMPLACRLMGFGCDEAKTSYPVYHVLSVGCIAYGAFLLGKGTSKGSAKTPAAKYLGPLPLGSWYILLNCVIYGFTSRMDKVAIKSAGKTIYYAYGRLLMASSTLGGSVMSGALTIKELKKFTATPVVTLIGAICLADAVYMLSLYQAFAWISPVYVTAIKRGGGILLSSILGVLLFGESVAGRFGPILTICLGVTFLCL
eukprot:CAMPEP_0181297272 /NCGR_PEP_ID=MMETSP1101-20121128/5150_1 /TAXON_ID=46948 /ORGANISM="Rhodomonas abbreviata, Strain Caron Lab Isolate" /LENGTH=474 /DNA_ID=CAMNT_0023402195 /DNA_START=137 /DNA_END=1561 /DNA_ORIENTATION=-